MIGRLCAGPGVRCCVVDEACVAGEDPAGCRGAGSLVRTASSPLRLCGFSLYSGGRSSGSVIPRDAMIFCCLVGRGLRVEPDASIIGGA